MAHTRLVISARPAHLSWFGRVALGGLGIFIAHGLGAGASAQAQDLSVYSDAPLAEGWESGSWATVELASTAVVHSGPTAIAVAAGPYGAVALQHAPFSTAGYGTLEFWIKFTRLRLTNRSGRPRRLYGGGGGQPRLAVKVTVNGVEQPVAVEIGPVAANAWRQVSIPLASFGIDDVPNFTAIWIQEFAEVDQTQNPFYVDDVMLGVAVPIIPAPPLRGAIALYDDSFANDWQNWSWASVDGASTAAVNSIAVTAAAYTALRFHHTPLDSGPYESLTFWINGGGNGGQILSLNALIADVVQPGSLVGPLVANTWQKIVVPLADLAAAKNPNVTDFWLQEIAGVDSSTFYVDDVRLDLAPPPSVVNVTVDAKNRIRRGVAGLAEHDDRGGVGGGSKGERGARQRRRGGLRHVG